MASIYTEVTLDMPPDELWKRVADVGAISGMFDLITESSAEGDTRHCTLIDGSELTERIVAVDDEHRRVAYTILESKTPYEFHAASMQVFDAGGGRSTLRWITDVAPDAIAERIGPLFEAELAKLPERLSAAA